MNTNDRKIQERYRLTQMGYKFKHFANHDLYRSCDIWCNNQTGHCMLEIDYVDEVKTRQDAYLRWANECLDKERKRIKRLLEKINEGKPIRKHKEKVESSQEG